MYLSQHHPSSQMNTEDKREEKKNVFLVELSTDIVHGKEK